MIKQLPASVQSCIRSGVAITSVTQCVEELLLNSVDAGAKCIAVRVDFSCFRIQVVDNGCGIAAEQLDKVGQRYSTSKCQSLEDLDSLNYFGYRGEALASLCTISSLLEINTRTQLSAQTYNKIFQHGKPLPTIESKHPRPSAGTTITLHNLFYNLPVRQKSIRLSLELENICHRVQALSLLQPKLSITLRNDVTGSTLLQTHKTSSLLNTFSYLFGHSKSQSLCDVSHNSGYFSLSGYIGRDSHCRKDIQFIYINNRLILNTKIHKVVNKVLKKSLIVKQKQTSEYGVKLSPLKLSNKYPIFLLNIKCPLNVYDITFDPAKTMVEFIEMEQLLHTVEQMCLDFIKKENLMTVDSLASELKKDSKIQLNGRLSPLESEMRDPDKDIDDNIEDQLYDNVKSRALKSLPIKRHLFKTSLHEQYNDDDDDIPSKFSKNDDDDNKIINHCLVEDRLQHNSEDPNENEYLTEDTDELTEDVHVLLTEDNETPLVKSSPNSTTLLNSCTELLTDSISTFTETPSTVEEDPISNERVKCAEDTNRNISAQRKKDSSPHGNGKILQYKPSESNVTSWKGFISPNKEHYHATKMALPSAFRKMRTDLTRVPSEMKPPTRSILDQFRSSKSIRQFSSVGTKKCSVLISESLISPNDSKLSSFREKFCDKQFPDDTTTLKDKLMAESHHSLSSKLSNLLRKKSLDKIQTGEKGEDRGSNVGGGNLATTKAEKPEEIPVLENHLTVTESFPCRIDGISLLKESEKKYTSLRENHDVILNNHMKQLSEISANVQTLSKRQNEHLHNFVERKFLTSSSFLQTYRSAENYVKSNLKISKDFTELKFPNLNLKSYSTEKLMPGDQSHTFFDDSGEIGVHLPSVSWNHTIPISTTINVQECDILSKNDSTEIYRFDNNYEDRAKKPFVFNFDTESESNDAILYKTGKFDTIDIPNSSLCLNSDLHSKESTSTEYFTEKQYKQPISLTDTASVYQRSNSTELSETVQNFCSFPPINQVSFSPNQFLPEVQSDIHLQRLSLFQDALQSRVGDRIMVNSFEDTYNTRYVDRISPSKKIEDADFSNLGHSVYSCTKPHKTQCLGNLLSKTEHLFPCISSDEMEQEGLGKNIDNREQKLGEFSGRALRNVPEDRTKEYIPFNVVLLNNYGSSSEEEEERATSIGVLSESLSKSERSNHHKKDHLQTEEEELNKVANYEESRNIPGASNSSCVELYQENMTKTYLSETNTEYSKWNKYSNLSKELFFLQKPESSTSSTQVNLEPYYTNLNSKLQHMPDLNPLSGSALSKDFNIVQSNSERNIQYFCDIDNQKSLAVIKENGLTKPSSLNYGLGMYLSEKQTFEEDPVTRNCSILQQNHTVSTKNESQREDCNVVDDGVLLVDNTCNSRSQQVEQQLCRYQGENTSQLNIHCLKDEGDQTTENSSLSDSYISVNGSQSVGPVSSQPSQDHSRNTESNHTADNCGSYLSHDHNINRDSNETVNKCSDDERQDKMNSNQFDLFHKISISTNIKKLTNISATKNTNLLECAERDLATRYNDLVSVKQNDSKYSTISQGFDSDRSVTPDALSATRYDLVSMKQKDPIYSTISQEFNSDISVPPDPLVACTNSTATPTVTVDAEDFSVNNCDSDDKIIEMDNTNSAKEIDPVIELWNNWKNPVFQQPEKEILNVKISNFKNVKHHRVTHHCQFTKTMLSQIETIGQVDKKFIACIVRPKNSSTTTPGHLIIVDQHAAHERVRLEQLTEEMYQTEDGNGENGKRISSSIIVPPLILTFSDREIRVTRSFLPEFLQIGIELTVSVGANSVEVHTVPSCIAAREASERKYNRGSVIEDLMQALIKEHIDFLQDTHGSRGSIPKTIHNVLCSQACHSAIKFGTVLTLKECKDLMQMLRKCKLPFQCAHGRPSMIPLLNMQYFKNSHEESKCKVQLGKLREKLERLQQQQQR